MIKIRQQLHVRIINDRYISTFISLFSNDLYLIFKKYYIRSDCIFFTFFNDDIIDNNEIKLFEFSIHKNNRNL